MIATVELEWMNSPGATVEVPVESQSQWDYALMIAMLHCWTKFGARNFTSVKVTKIV